MSESKSEEMERTDEELSESKSEEVEERTKR